MTKIALHWPISFAGNSYGTVGWDLEEKGGWPGFIKNHVSPAIKWTESYGHKPEIIIHHPFGQYMRPMHLDGYDYAKGADIKWLINNFATLAGWKSVTSTYTVLGYLGGFDLIPDRRRLPALELAALIKQNLKPLKDALFSGVFIDYAENAIYDEFKSPYSPEHNALPSVDTMTLAIADAMFPKFKTGVEAIPRAFPLFKHLWSRPTIIQEKTYQHRYGPGRHTDWKALGYDINVITGPIYRTFTYTDDLDSIAEQIKSIVADGHIPVICPQPFVRANYPLSKLLA